MDTLSLLTKARKADLEVMAEGAKLIVRGPKSLESLALKVLDAKSELMPLLQQESFHCWVLEEWRRVSIPAWRRILAESKVNGDKDREDYARWMLREVLLDPDREEGDASRFLPL